MLLEGRRTHIPLSRVKAGDYLEFVYNTKARTVVVITPDYNDNLDAYEVTEEDRDELLEQVRLYKKSELEDGLLWNIFRDTIWQFKSFKRSKIGMVRLVEFIDSEDEPKMKKQPKTKQKTRPIEDSE